MTVIEEIAAERRNFIKAAACIVAKIERLDREIQRYEA